MLKITKKVGVTKSCKEIASSKDIKVCNRHINMNVQIKDPTLFLLEVSEKIKFPVKDLKTFEFFETSLTQVVYPENSRTSSFREREKDEGAIKTYLAFCMDYG